MNCPVCNIALIMSERQGIEIDYCPQCRGVWLDRGELDKIIERSAAERKQYDQHGPYEKHNKHYDDHHEHHDHYKYRKKKSFLDELFD